MDEIGHEDNDSCASNNVAVDNDEVNDLGNDLNDEDAIHLNDELGDVEGFVIDRVQHEEDNQQYHFEEVFMVD